MQYKENTLKIQNTHFVKNVKIVFKKPRTIIEILKTTRISFIKEVIEQHIKKKSQQQINKNYVCETEPAQLVETFGIIRDDI